MNPVTRPFLSGKWLHPALKTDDYINPLYNPIANENSHKKTVGLNLNDAHTNTILKATTPPIAMTGRVPPSLSTKWLPNGKKKHGKHDHKRLKAIKSIDIDLWAS